MRRKTCHFVFPCHKVIGPLQLDIHKIRVDTEVATDHGGHLGVEIPLTVLDALAVVTSGWRPKSRQPSGHRRLRESVILNLVSPFWEGPTPSPVPPARVWKCPPAHAVKASMMVPRWPHKVQHCLQDSPAKTPGEPGRFPNLP